MESGAKGCEVILLSSFFAFSGVHFLFVSTLLLLLLFKEKFNVLVYSGRLL